MPTVTIACKLPNGLILKVYDMVEMDEPVMGGPPRRKKEARQIGEPVTIKGNSVPMNVQLETPFQNSYALTHNVDAEFWERWYEQNKTSAIVRNGLIYASDKALNVQAFTKEHKDVRSGFERMAQAGDPRSPARVKDDPERMAQRN